MSTTSGDNLLGLPETLLPDDPAAGRLDAGVDARQVAAARNDFVEFLIGCQRTGMRVVGYGAPGKGNTLLNHCGIRSDLMEFTVDRNPHKHGLFLPGSGIASWSPVIAKWIVRAWPGRGGVLKWPRSLRRPPAMQKR